jgi:TM2 domain-containing membrane protein YozV
MAKIIKVELDKVLIGMDDGSIKEVQPSACSNFIPEVGMEVDVFTNENTVIITKKTSAQNVLATGFSKGKHHVNKLVYILLCLFFGGIGIHKFYAGHIVAGIFYILFFWTLIPSLIALVELIIGICKEADANGEIDA